MKDALGHGSDPRGGSGEAQVHGIAAAHGINTGHLIGPAKPESGWYYHSTFAGPVAVKLHEVKPGEDYGRHRAVVEVTARNNRVYPKGTKTEVPANDVFRKGSLHVTRGSGRYASYGPTAASTYIKK